MLLLKSIKQCHHYLSKVIKNGDYVIDATAGNGHDTLFLARQVAPLGKVYSIDIQQEALDRTSRLLKGEDLLNLVELIKGNHAHLTELVKDNVQAAVFNLGYLPKGDHTIVTKPSNTILGVEGALQLLNPGGIITIVAYPGHKPGQEEIVALVEFFKSLEQRYVTILKYEFINQINNPPILFILEKHCR